MLDGLIGLEIEAREVQSSQGRHRLDRDANLRPKLIEQAREAVSPHR